MFDSPLCDRPFPSYPFFTYFLQHPWFTSFLQFSWFVKLPIVVVLLLSAFFGLRWVIQRTRWRHRFSSPKSYLLLFGLTATLPLIIWIVADKGLVVFLPTDSGTTTDSIVVLGRGFIFDTQRIDLATELWQAKRAPRIFVSGRGDSQRLIERLKAKGIPNQVVDGENCSVSTLENAVFTAAILQPQGIRRILLITDEPHMLRSLLLFRANGFTVIPRAAPVPPHWRYKEKALLTFREWTGLFSYVFRGLFDSQNSSELKNPEIVNIIQIAEQYGQQRRP
ncbi:MAG TPA: YdcF family protein [Oculatellaceae cyanobacterium]